jgi:hypothetical protein
MLDNNCEYGSLTTYASTFYLRCLGPEVVYISDGVRDTARTDVAGISTRRGYLHLLQLADATARPHHDAAAKRRLTDPWLSAKVDASVDVPAPLLHLAGEIPCLPWTSFRMRSCLGGGRSSSVGHVVCDDGAELALKMFDIGKGCGLEAFTSELSAYQELMSLVDAEVFSHLCLFLF